MPRSNFQDKVRPLVSVLAIFAATSLGSCRKIRTGAQGGGYTDSELRAIRGIQISTSGYETTFMIPWFLTFKDDRDYLFRQLTKSYIESMGDLREEFTKSKAQVKGFAKVTAITEYNDQIRKVVDEFAKDASKDPAAEQNAQDVAGRQNSDIYMSVSKQSLVQSYLPPGQALVLFAAADFKFTPPLASVVDKVLTNSGTGVGRTLGALPNTIVVNVALVYIVQPFVVVTIDNHTKKEKLNPDGSPRRGYKVDGALMLMPSLGGGRADLGSSMAFTGGSLPATLPAAATSPLLQGQCALKVIRQQFQVGIGTLLGPLDSPHDMLGYGGIDFRFDASFIRTGLYARFLALGKFGKAPLFMTFIGADVGCSIASRSMSLTALLDPLSFVSWINGGADGSKLKDARAVNELIKNSNDPNFKGENVELSL